MFEWLSPRHETYMCMICPCWHLRGIAGGKRKMPRGSRVGTEEVTALYEPSGASTPQQLRRKLVALPRDSTTKWFLCKENFPSPEGENNRVLGNLVCAYFISSVVKCTIFYIPLRKKKLWSLFKYNAIFPDHLDLLSTDWVFLNLFR